MTHDGTQARPPQPAQVLNEHLAHFRTRVLYDALLEGTASYWRHRADQFDAVGTPSADETATACRHHADLLEDIGLDSETRTVIDDILGHPWEGVA